MIARLRRLFANAPAASSTMYPPLPPAASSHKVLSNAAPKSPAGAAWPTPFPAVNDFLYAHFAPVLRTWAWVRSTAAPPDSPIGRFAAWLDDVPLRYGWYFVALGNIIALGIAVFVWHVDTPKRELLPMLLTAPIPGTMLGFMFPLIFFQLAALAVSYWRWVAGYALFIFAIMGFRIMIGLPPAEK